MKKLISVILLLCMLLTAFAACTDDEKPPVDTNDEQQETAEPNYLDSLPTMDLGGQEFKFLISSQHETFYDQEAETGDIVESACFARNLSIEERYNVDIVYTAMDGNSSGQTEFQGAITNSLQAGQQDAFRLIIGQNYYCLPLFTQGAYHNLRESDVIDFDAEWSHKMINENGTVNGKLYGGSGAIVISQLTHALALAYNKRIFVDYGLAEQYDIYQIVREGKWTWALFYEMVTAFDDVDEDAANVVYGFENFHHAAVGLHAGMGNNPIVKNAEGEYTMDDYYNDRLESIYSRIREFFNDHAAVATTEQLQKLTNGNGGSYIDHLLFYMNYLHGLVEMEKVENRPVGVLPAPKYDEEQAEYYTHIMRDDLYYIPANVDFETSALMVEALNYETYKVVYPEYWDKVVELRSADTSEDREMIQLLASTVYSSFGTYFAFSLSDIDEQLVKEALKNSSSMSVWWGNNQKALKIRLTRLINSFE